MQNHLSENLKKILAILPNTRFKAIVSNKTLNLRHEYLWEICCASNFSWDDLIAYELYLTAIFSKQGTQEYDFSKILGHTNEHWETLCKKDYPNIKITKKFRHEYLSQPDVLNKASRLGQQDSKILKILHHHQSNDRKWQYSIETLTQRVRQNPACLNDAVLSVRNNKNLMLAAVRQDGWALAYLSEALRNDREIVLAAVRESGNALEFASEALRNDREIVLAAVRRYGSALRYASEALRNDREIVLAAVRQDGWALAYLSEELRNDRKFVFRALAYASEALRNDREIVLAAVRQDGWVLEYASKALRNDREIVLAAVRQRGWALQFASEALRNDREIVLAAVRQSGLALRYASEALRNDREIVLAAVGQWGWALEYASVALRNDREIVLAAVRENGRALEFASEALRNDLAIVLASARESKGYSLKYAPSRVKSILISLILLAIAANIVASIMYGPIYLLLIPASIYVGFLAAELCLKGVEFVSERVNSNRIHNTN